MDEDPGIIWLDKRLRDVNRQKALIGETLRKHNLENLEPYILSELGRVLVKDYIDGMEGGPRGRANEFLMTFGYLRDGLIDVMGYMKGDAEVIAICLLGRYPLTTLPLIGPSDKESAP